MDQKVQWLLVVLLILEDLKVLCLLLVQLHQCLLLFQHFQLLPSFLEVPENLVVLVGPEVLSLLAVLFVQ